MSITDCMLDATSRERSSSLGMLEHTLVGRRMLSSSWKNITTVHSSSVLQQPNQLANLATTTCAISAKAAAALASHGILLTACAACQSCGISWPSTGSSEAEGGSDIDPNGGSCSRGCDYLLQLRNHESDSFARKMASIAAGVRSRPDTVLPIISSLSTPFCARLASLRGAARALRRNTSSTERRRGVKVAPTPPPHTSTAVSIAYLTIDERLTQERARNAS